MKRDLSSISRTSHESTARHHNIREVMKETNQPQKMFTLLWSRKPDTQKTLFFFLCAFLIRTVSAKTTARPRAIVSTTCENAVAYTGVMRHYISGLRYSESAIPFFYYFPSFTFVFYSHRRNIFLALRSARTCVGIKSRKTSYVWLRYTRLGKEQYLVIPTFSGI